MKYLLIFLWILTTSFNDPVEFGRVSAINITKRNSFRVSIYEDEIKKIAVTLPPTARISLESRSDRVYKIKVTRLTNSPEISDCTCPLAKRDKFDRAIIEFNDDFQITVIDPRP